MKKICFICFNIEDMGGITRVVSNLCREICEDYSVSIISICNTNKEPHYEFSDKIKIYKLNNNPDDRIKNIILKSFFELKTILKSEKFDVIFMEGHYIPPIVLPLRFFTKSKNTTSVMGLDVLYGIVTIILGCLIIKNPGAIGSLLPIVLGIAIIVSSANKIQYAFNLKNSDNDLWKTTMIISVIGTICGVVLLFNPFAGAVLLMRIVGIFIIVYAILDAVSTFIIKKNVEEFKNVIESQSAKVKEADIVEEKETDEKVNKKKNTKNVKKGKRKNNNEET